MGLRPQCDYNFDLRIHPATRAIVPVIFLCLIVYGSWAYIHKFCITQLYNHSKAKATAIALIITHGFLLITAAIIWLQLLMIGPGKQPHVAPFELIRPANLKEGQDLDYPVTTIPPTIYQSDPNGYPTWCSECQSVKTFRSHHSTPLKQCIPRFDHYCAWLGTVIGRTNYRLFIQFLIYCTVMFGIIWITVITSYLSIFNKRNHDGNLVATMIIAAMGFFFVLSLLASHIFYIGTKNMASIDVIGAQGNKNKDKVVFICIWYESKKTRYVVKVTRKEYSHFWNKGSIIANLKDTFGTNILFWIIPYGNYPILQSTTPTPIESFQINLILGIFSESVNEKAIELIHAKIDNGDYVTIIDAYGDRFR